MSAFTAPKLELKAKRVKSKLKKVDSVGPKQTNADLTS